MPSKRKSLQSPHRTMLANNSLQTTNNGKKSMKIVKYLSAVLAALAFAMPCSAQYRASNLNDNSAKHFFYERDFTEKQLRIDLTFSGNSEQQSVQLASLKQEAQWSGSKSNLIDPFNYGEYRIEVIDSTRNEVLFSKGFNSLFQEWRTTDEAKELSRAFNSSCRIPYPKKSVKIIISERVRENGEFAKLGEFYVNPYDKSINKERENNYAVTAILENGNPENKVDLVFVAEGYSAEDMDKFRADAKRFAGYLFEMEPYKSRQEDFNIWAVESVSAESGTDIPHHDIWKNTVANSHFYTFKSDRYLTAPDHTLLCKLTSNAPCDAIYVIVNTDKYGGGGIFNYYGLSMSDHKTAPMVFVHEFGHSFAGLADEYFYEYDDVLIGMYNTEVEPWEPNITSLVDFDKKWKHLLPPGTAIPTEVKEGEPQLLGVYEGGGYMTKGIYRPVDNCRMRTNEAPGFCEVCRRAIERMIDYYCK